MIANAGASAAPAGPTVYEEALALLASPYATAHDVATVLSRDKTLNARLLRQINSAQFGLTRRITDTAEAAWFLGFERVRSLLADSAAQEALPTSPSGVLLAPLTATPGTAATSNLALQAQ